MITIPPVIYNISSAYDETILNEFRKHLITEMTNQATTCKMQMRIGKTKKHYDKYEAKAESYEYMVHMLKAITYKVK